MTGKNLKIRYGAGPTTLRVFEATILEEVGEVDETDGESGGYGERADTGVQECSITFKANWRAADGAPPLAGDVLADVLVAWDGNTVVPVVNKRHLFTYVKILSAERTGQTRGKIEVTYTAKSSGPYKLPGVA